MADEPNNNRRADGKFAAGNRAGGRTFGAVRKMTARAMARLDRHSDEIIQQAIASALDPKSPSHAIALRLCVERLVPVARHEPTLTRLDLPRMETARDLPAVTAALLIALVDGRIALPDIAPVLEIVRTTATAISTGDHDQRLAELERLIEQRRLRHGT
jgi:hypothetical protein